ncbi:entry exclusion lipoprotein TrbK [Sulfuricurvum sp.]|uniref:entry exclusion lipoprotein TrbK n=1 Tax=Sulfuricurvum sp. TaxID=2025608 RepID=UPI002617F661|nr:entry exclusion lipoprotein TrbK [Sulfuricurvum sp.]MDD3596173.1 entry exclusion lipoprotein TrbK [Sulfuricurvum sp.]
MKTLTLLAAAAAIVFMLSGCVDKTTPETAKETVQKVITAMSENNTEEFKKYCSNENLKKYEKQGLSNLTVPGLKLNLTNDPVKMSNDGKTAEVVVNMSLQGAFETKSIWTLKDENGEWKIYGDARAAE